MLRLRLKFYLHVSSEEQLARFKERLDDPQRNWKIYDSDYTEREHWPAYIEVFEDAISKTNTVRAPWYIIPSNHKWFRNLVVSNIPVNTLEDMNFQIPKPSVDLKAIRRRYHSAMLEQKSNHHKLRPLAGEAKSSRLRGHPEKTARERPSRLHLPSRKCNNRRGRVCFGQRLARDDHWVQAIYLPLWSVGLVRGRIIDLCLHK